MTRRIVTQSWIERLPAEARGAVEGQLRTRVFYNGEAIYLSGDEAAECYRIRSGFVRVTEYSAVGREFQLTSLRAGDSFGEIGVIDELPRFNNAFATADTELDVLEKTGLDRLRVEHPAIERSLNLHLCQQIRHLATKVTEASLLTLKERLPRLLCELGDARGSHLPRTDGERREITHLSQNDLANMLGATRQNVSRELKELERQEWIVLQYKSISITRFTAFAHRFGDEPGEAPGAATNTRLKAGTGTQRPAGSRRNE